MSASIGGILEQLRGLNPAERAQLERLESQPWFVELVTSSSARARAILEQLERAELAGVPSEPLSLAELEEVLEAEGDSGTVEPLSADALTARDSGRKAGYPVGRCLPNGDALRLLP